MPDSALQRPEVTAVVVTCGATPYLRRTLEGLAAQTRLPTRVVLVDIWASGRDLGSGEDIQTVVSELGLDTRVMVRVVRAPEATNFGDAVRRGLALNAEAQQRADRLHETRTGEVPIVHNDTSAGWLWLLHDDSAPAPAALEELLRAGESGPSIGIAGAKQRDWARPDHILEVGIQATRSARRFNPIDEDEIDQGQHDAADDVLAVGLAGAIVRRDVWARLDGTDPALGPFGDGLELSRRARLAGFRVVVVPAAVVFHARASYLGLRSYGHAAPRTTTPDLARSFGARRRAQLYNWILAVPGWQVPLVALAILVLTPARALARFAGKDITRARAEFSAGSAVLSRPDLWSAGRRRTRATQVMPASQLAPLEASAREIRRKKGEQRRAAAEARTLLDAPSELELSERAQLATKRRATGIGLTVLVTALAAVGFGRLLGAGELTGGALLPSSARFGDVLSLTTAGWLPVGHGAPGPADPVLTLALLPLLSGITLGTAATWLLLLAVPLAAVAAWFAAGAITRSIGLRTWATVLWALAPTLLISILEGRTGPVLTHVLLPFLLLAIARATGTARRDVILSGMVGARRVVHHSVPLRDAGEAPGEPLEPQGPLEPLEPETVPPPVDPVARRPASLAAGASAALLLAAVSAATPALLPVGVLLGLVLLATPARRTTWFLPLPALVLFGPLLTEVARTGDWEVLASGPGVPLGYEPAAPLATLLGVPSTLDVSSLPVWLTWVAVVPGAFAILIALLALLRGSFRLRGVRVGWLLAVAGLVLALAAPHVAVALDGAGAVVRAWPGAGVSLTLLGFLVAALSGADGVPNLLTQHQFGWRHLGAAALTAVAAATAVSAAVTWVWAARSGVPELQALTSAPTETTPALSRQLASAEERARTLALTADSDGAVTAHLWREDGPQLHLTASIAGAREITEPLGFTASSAADEASSELAGLVSEIVAGVVRDAGARLADHGVGVVLVPPASGTEELARAGLVAALDSTAGLARVTENESGIVWRVATDGRDGAADSIHRATVRDSGGTLLQTVPSEAFAASGHLASGPSGRILHLTERADPGWTLTVDGTRAAQADAGWHQAFALPAGSGEVRLTYAPPGRAWWIAAQAVVIGLTALLALPVRRRREGA